MGTRYHLALADAADEAVGTLARLFAYVGTLALLAILALAALDELSRLGSEEPARRSDLAANGACNPGLLADISNSINKSIAYLISEDDSGLTRDACAPSGSPDWLRASATMPLRGSL